MSLYTRRRGPQPVCGFSWRPVFDSRQSSDADLGTAVLSVLQGSMWSIPHPTDWKGVLEPLLKAAGVKSWKAFATGTLGVHVEAAGDQLQFVPMVNLGPKEGFKDDAANTRVVMLPAVSHVVGATLRGAFEHAR
jgi:hypothetical protein